MKINEGIKQFTRFISPAYYAARVTFPSYSGTMKQIVIFSSLASLLEAAGLGLIYFLLLIFTGSELKSPSGIHLVDQFLSSPFALTVACVLLLTSGVTMKRAMIKKTMGVSSESGTSAAKLSLAHARTLVFQDIPNSLTDKNFRQLVSTLVKDIPFACGFAARGFSLISINLVQAVILFLVMLFLSPLLTASVLLIAVVFLGFLSTSYAKLLGVATDRSGGVAQYRAEIQELAEGMKNRSTSEQEFSTQVANAFSTGSSYEQLRLRLALRSERATGSLVIEYIYPIALIGISMLYMYSDRFAPDITKIAVYFLLVRQAVSSLYSVGSTFISFSKHHAPLVAFSELMQDNILPGKLDEID